LALRLRSAASWNASTEADKRSDLGWWRVGLSSSGSGAHNVEIVDYH
jgi:hypothetical protein